MNNQRIKILHIADKFSVKGSSIHGVSRLFSWWFSRFDTSRYEVHLIVLRKADAGVKEIEKRGLKFRSLDKRKYDPFTLKEIVRKIRSYKADILHLHGYGATNFGRIAARIEKVKSIVHEHFVDPDMPKYQQFADFVLSPWADYGIAVSGSVKDFMVNKRYLPAEKVSVIFNGAPLREFKPMIEEDVAVERAKWKIPYGYKVVSTIGRLDKQKGNKYFIEAANKILKGNKKVKFMLVGDGPLLHELNEQCNQLGIQKDIIFTGYHSNIPLIQSMIDIQVFPSLWEGTPLTLFEAMSMQRPIVSTNVDGLGEVLRHGKNALVVHPKDSENLAAAIQALLKNPEKANALAAQAQRDSNKYDIQSTVDEMQLVYDDLVDSGPLTSDRKTERNH